MGNGQGDLVDGWVVRAPEDADLARWAELYRGYAGFYRSAQGDAERERVWSWIRDPDHEVEGLLVQRPGGPVVGLAHHRPFARPLTATTGCFLDDLFVDPAERGSGAADALLVALRPEAFDAVPFLDLLTAYGSPWEIREGG